MAKLTVTGTEGDVLHFLSEYVYGVALNEDHSHYPKHAKTFNQFFEVGEKEWIPFVAVIGINNTPYLLTTTPYRIFGLFEKDTPNSIEKITFDLSLTSISDAFFEVFFDNMFTDTEDRGDLKLWFEHESFYDNCTEYVVISKFGILSASDKMQKHLMKGTVEDIELCDDEYVCVWYDTDGFTTDYKKFKGGDAELTKLALTNDPNTKIFELKSKKAS